MRERVAARRIDFADAVDLAGHGNDTRRITRRRRDAGDQIAAIIGINQERAHRAPGALNLHVGNPERPRGEPGNVEADLQIRVAAVANGIVVEQLEILLPAGIGRDGHIEARAGPRESAESHGGAVAMRVVETGERNARQIRA